ncbi:MAG TPA: helix-turn-helix transcriptional regulator [Candidatus Fimivivens faecavium]|nr:helix-turn-helix transcriptional regulator [Candidatus Fimivivens faecavium]
MPISFGPLREHMKKNKVSYYFLANQGIDNRTIDRLRHDKAITTTTLNKLCSILNCQPGELIRYDPDPEPDAESGCRKQGTL